MNLTTKIFLLLTFRSISTYNLSVENGLLLLPPKMNPFSNNKELIKNTIKPINNTQKYQLIGYM